MLTYIYINKAVYVYGEIVKVGISVNVHKRITEFNNGLRHREKHYKEIKGVIFENFFCFPFDKRDAAEEVERKFHQKGRAKVIKEFGREVFKMKAFVAKNIISNIIANHIR